MGSQSQAAVVEHKEDYLEFKKKFQEHSQACLTRCSQVLTVLGILGFVDLGRLCGILGEEN